MTLNFKGDSLNIHYIDEGTGEAVLLLHGWGANAELYRSIINILTLSFRVLAPDMPGFGKSDEPSFAYSADDYADFALSFLSALSIKKAILIGHSHGGRTIIKLASRKPKEITIPKIILIDSAGIVRKKSLPQKAKITFYKLSKTVLKIGLVEKAFPNALENLRKKTGSADYQAASPIMRQSLVKVVNEDLTDILSDISSPTLLIWGENDTATPLSDGKTMEKLISDSGLVILPKASHYSFLDSPFVFKKVLCSFLNIKE